MATGCFIRNCDGTEGRVYGTFSEVLDMLNKAQAEGLIYAPLIKDDDGTQYALDGRIWVKIEKPLKGAF